ncbi:MAG: hypothetical protein J4O01_10295, partial [Chloroflexi bacterium]|nr:hypothetical protein [Chloroflexota bacterium]
VRNVEAALAAESLLVIEPGGTNTPEGGATVADFTGGRAIKLRRELVERAGQVQESAVLFELARLGG